MATTIEIINEGLRKIGAGRIRSIDPAQSEIEKHARDGYEIWRDDELSKRRWRFAMAVGVPNLTQPVGAEYAVAAYRYQLPPSTLRVIRRRGEKWAQYESFLFSDEPLTSVEFIKRVAEPYFPPVFVNVLGARCAMELAEIATQSRTKKADAAVYYREFVKEAARINAFVTGPESIEQDDADSAWLQARFGFPPS